MRFWIWTMSLKRFSAHSQWAAFYGGQFEGHCKLLSVPKEPLHHTWGAKIWAIEEWKRWEEKNFEYHMEKVSLYYIILNLKTVTWAGINTLVLQKRKQMLSKTKWPSATQLQVSEWSPRHTPDATYLPHNKQDA